MSKKSPLIHKIQITISGNQSVQQFTLAEASIKIAETEGNNKSEKYISTKKCVQCVCRGKKKLASALKTLTSIMFVSLN